MIWRHIVRKSPKKPNPPSFGTFLWGDPLRIFRRLIPCQKPEWWGYQMVYISRSCFRSARHNTGVWRTDRQANKTNYAVSFHYLLRQTIWQSSSRICIIHLYYNCLIIMHTSPVCFICMQICTEQHCNLKAAVTRYDFSYCTFLLYCNRLPGPKTRIPQSPHKTEYTFAD